jgi:hypothetical protein
MTLGGIRANPVRPPVGKAGAGKFKKASRSFTRSSQTLVGCFGKQGRARLAVCHLGVVGPARPSSSAS